MLGRYHKYYHKWTGIQLIYHLVAQSLLILIFFCSKSTIFHQFICKSESSQLKYLNCKKGKGVCVLCLHPIDNSG